MSVQTTRTAGPWVTETTEGGLVQITDSATRTHCIATTRKRIDAAFIVQACNAHDDLVVALRNLKIIADAVCAVMRQRESLPSARGAVMGDLHERAIEAGKVLAKASAL